MGKVVLFDGGGGGGGVWVSECAMCDVMRQWVSEASDDDTV